VTILDTLLQAYIAALLHGFGVLHVLTLPLLGLVASLAFFRGMFPLIRAGIHPGEIWAHVLLMVFSLAGYVYLLSNFRDLSLGIFDLAADLGARIGGLSGSALTKPSGVIDAGAKALTPITEFVERHSGWEALKNIGTLMQMSLIYDVVLFAFIGIALNMSLTVISWHFSVLLGTVLLPWAPLGVTAFISEWVLGWIVGMTVRMLIMTALIGISIPLFERLVITLTPGGDPSFWGSVAVLVGAILFFLLSWIIPNRVTGLAAAGLAISGGDVLYQGARAAGSIGRIARGTNTVVRGVSQMLQRERSAA
jgi:type IV secretory pathway TrbL component